MPIKGISERRRLPRLGKIRLGEKGISQSGAEYPKKIDYFDCPPEVQAVYGEKPRQLDVIFPVDSLEIIFPQYLKRYGSSKGLVCKGNGETADVVDESTGEMTEVVCDPNECEFYAKKHCRRVASLQFMLPKVPGFGVYQIDTTSYNSIVNLNSWLAPDGLLHGKPMGLPLLLRLVPQEVHFPGKEGKRAKGTAFVLSLTTSLSLEQMRALQGGTAVAGAIADRPSEEQPTDLYPGVAREPGDDGGDEPDPIVPEKEVTQPAPAKPKRLPF
jgi:hypothetical protein